MDQKYQLWKWALPRQRGEELEKVTPSSITSQSTMSHWLFTFLYTISLEYLKLVYFVLKIVCIMYSVFFNIAIYYIQPVLDDVKLLHSITSHVGPCFLVAKSVQGTFLALSLVPYSWVLRNISLFKMWTLRP